MDKVHIDNTCDCCGEDIDESCKDDTSLSALMFKIRRTIKKHSALANTGGSCTHMVIRIEGTIDQSFHALITP